VQRLITVIRKHPVLSYFSIAFGITWLGILVVVLPTGLPGQGSDIPRLLPLVFLAMIAGPATSSLVLTGVVEGKAGYRKLIARLFHVRFHVLWYTALLITPVLLAVILGLLSLLSPAYLPGILTARDKLGFVTLALVAGLAAGVFEELGWTGLATPRLLSRHGYLAAGLIIGVPWALWHDLASYWGGAEKYGPLYLLDALLWALALPAYRILMVWVYDHTGSLLLGMLMHASFTASQGLLGPAVFVAANDVLWYGIFAVALWMIVAAVAQTEARRGAQRLAPVRRGLTHAHW
jgi:membrane protease YdiL (CAAX protease family)